MPAHRRGTEKSVAAIFLSGTQKLSFHLVQKGKALQKNPANARSSHLLCGKERAY